ncbi:MAG TPA: bifunctional UDP-sugar hydrolase/5'-nucleotidase [Atopostipes sp.]|nr:bifunctional UDP-sugar hydrolase/5'-nucleotidase [Atopostipes sp.]
MSDAKIYIYHTNDIHSDLTYWPRLAKELQEKRAMRHQNGDDVFAFDIGDAVDRVHPLTEATNGQAITELLNEGMYDGVTIGNNEGITNSKEELNQLYDQAKFPVILTNLFDDATGEVPNWVTPYKIFETHSEERIGVFGLTAPLYETYEALGWKVTNPVKETQRFFKQHGDKADFWILLSHLGIDDDRFLSKLFPIPLILGAHTHHVLMEGEQSASSTLAGAGQFGNWLGEVVIGRDHGGLRVESAQLLNAKNDLQPTPTEEEKVEAYEHHGHQLLRNETIADLPKDLPASWSKQSALADAVLEAIADFVDTEAAIFNAGLLMSDLSAGVVTADDLHQCLPHPMRVMRGTVKGEHLIRFGKEIQNIDAKMTHRPVRGFGFRGEVFGKLCLKGMTLNQNRMLWNGKPVVPQKEYAIASIDYFSFLPFFDILNTYSTLEVIYPDFLRSVVGDYLAKTYPLNE